MTVYFAPRTLETLRRFTAYRTALDGKRRSPSDVIAEALATYGPLRRYERGKKKD